MPDSLPKRVLAVGAHPDDIEILCGGTMALYAKAGVEVTFATSTNGDRGSVQHSAEETARIRIAEAESAAKVIGASYVCLGFSDCYLDYSSLEVRERFIDLVREVDPDVVFTHDPNDYHADHIATSKHMYDAAFMASVPLIKTGIEAVKRVLPVIYMDTLAGHRFDPERYVDVTPVFELKKEMLAKHVSQVDWMKLHDDLGLMEFMETQTKFRGIQAEVRYAEAFRPAFTWLRPNVREYLPV